MRNYFNIVRSVGLMFFGLGMFLVVALLPEFMKRLNDLYGYTGGVWGDGLIVFVLIGLAFLFIGLAGLLKSKWFPKAGIIVLVISFFAFSWLFFLEILPDSRGEEFFIVISLITLAYIVMGSFILLLNNEHFLNALENEDIQRNEDDNILDA